MTAYRRRSRAGRSTAATPRSRPAGWRCRRRRSPASTTRARSSSTPAGSRCLRGPELALALDLEDPDVATQRGAGLRRVRGDVVRRRLLPRFGDRHRASSGCGRRARSSSPDPGEPFRFTLGFAAGARQARAASAFAWHHFRADGALDGADTFDLGLSTRFGNHLAFGATLRDVATRRHRRRRRCSAATSSRLVLAAARHRRARGRARRPDRRDARRRRRLGAACRRASRAGFYVHRGVETRELHALVDSPMGVRRTTTAATCARRSGSSCRSAALGVTRTAPACATTPATTTRSAARCSCAASARRPAVGARHARSHRARRARGRDRRARADVARRAAARDRARSDGEGAGRHVRRRRRAAGRRCRSCATRSSRVRKAGKKVFAYMVSGTGPRLLHRDAPPTRSTSTRRAACGSSAWPAPRCTSAARSISSACCRSSRRSPSTRARPSSSPRPAPTPTAAKMHERPVRLAVGPAGSTRSPTGRHLHQGRGQGARRRRARTPRAISRRTQKLVDAVAAPDKISAARHDASSARRTGRAPAGRAPRSLDAPGHRRHLRRRRHHRRQVAVDPAARPAARRRRDARRARSPRRATIRAIGAIILRIDSPGGSALASELISREVFATRGVKPIICSMSDLAASGGYFVAAGCDMIFAEPMTITGSIGIFYGKFDLGGLAQQARRHDRHATSAASAADVESLFRPYTDEERAVAARQAALHVRPVRRRGRRGPQADEGRGRRRRPRPRLHRRAGEADQARRQVRRPRRRARRGEAPHGPRARRRRSSSSSCPTLPSSLLGTVGKLLGVARAGDASLTDLPIVKELLRGVPASLLVAPEGAQARLPYDITFE